MKDKYLVSYDYLEVAPGCTWQEVRRAYKRLVKKWHPDHFHSDPRAQSLANEKIKEINCAFDLLSVYYRTHGVLPPIVKTLDTVVEKPDPDYTSAANHVQSQSTTTAYSGAQVSRDSTPVAAVQKTQYGIFARMAFILFILWVGYALWHTPQEPRDATTRVAVGPDSAIPVQDINYFTYGSTVGEVYAIQGTPSNTTESVWYYGKSKVHFNDGVVIHWYDDPSSPLRAKADNMPATQTLTQAFSIGSTKAEVLAIQGKPLMEWSGVWEYGLSKVYFDGDRVRGWYDSPLNPLMIRK